MKVYNSFSTSVFLEDLCSEFELKWQGSNLLLENFGTPKKHQNHSLYFKLDKKVYSGDGVAIVKEFTENQNEILSTDPLTTFLKIAQKYFTLHFSSSSLDGKCFIHPTACVEGSVSNGCYIGPFCWVAEGSHLEENVRLESNVSVHKGTYIGKGSVIQSGVVLGGDGFGIHQGQIIPHLGGVELGENCFIGANSVLAAGFIHPTQLGDHCKLDSLVQIAHNCKVGRGSIFCSQSGLGGSCQLGENVTLAGGAQVADHVSIAANTTVAAKAGVTKNIGPGTFAGFPAVPIKQWRQQQVAQRRK